ncbi:16S rRNA (guanine(527)-N(7))-methyltransferase RsmG [Sphingomonas kaistensis]|uniref:Ribosomal RNA small subunit methyltransferase G n=1 Tax=Sphingomonas kaistensis TaxID=298708 RepID=A0ABZ2G1U2_9SPHN
MIVSRETSDKLEAFADLLLGENSRQNLISRRTEEEIRVRHIDDSLQLLEHAPVDAYWLDIGSGPGLPGLVLAIAGVRHITLVEPRRLRTEFLEHCRETLALQNVTVITGKVENVVGHFDVVTARAVATLDKLFAMASPLIAPTGRWVLPKGRSAEMELAEARTTWQGDFELKPSRTDPDARILVAQRVRRRTGRK